MTEADYRNIIASALPFIKIDRIVWKNSHNCYIVIDGEEIPIYFTSPEDQVIIEQ